MKRDKVRKKACLEDIAQAYDSNGLLLSLSKTGYTYLMPSSWWNTRSSSFLLGLFFNLLVTPLYFLTPLVTEQFWSKSAFRSMYYVPMYYCSVSLSKKVSTQQCATIDVSNTYYVFLLSVSPKSRNAYPSYLTDSDYLLLPGPVLSILKQETSLQKWQAKLWTHCSYFLLALSFLLLPIPFFEKLDKGRWKLGWWIQKWKRRAKLKKERVSKTFLSHFTSFSL